MSFHLVCNGHPVLTTTSIALSPHTSRGRHRISVASRHGRSGTLAPSAFGLAAVSVMPLFNGMACPAKTTTKACLTRVSVRGKTCAVVSDLAEVRHTVWDIARVNHLWYRMVM
jgi:hypothetical protein